MRILLALGLTAAFLTPAYANLGQENSSPGPPAIYNRALSPECLHQRLVAEQAQAKMDELILAGMERFNGYLNAIGQPTVSMSGLLTQVTTGPMFIALASPALYVRQSFATTYSRACGAPLNLIGH